MITVNNIIFLSIGVSIGFSIGFSLYWSAYSFDKFYRKEAVSQKQALEKLSCNQK